MFGFGHVQKNKAKPAWLKSELIFVVLSAIVLSSGVYLRLTNLKIQPNGLEGDEITWIASSLFRQYDINPAEVGIWGVISDLSRVCKSKSVHYLYRNQFLQTVLRILAQFLGKSFLN
jgi:hypothetical protein